MSVSISDQTSYMDISSRLLGMSALSEAMRTDIGHILADLRTLSSNQETATRLTNDLTQSRAKAHADWETAAARQWQFQVKLKALMLELNDEQEQKRIAVALLDRALSGPGRGPLIWFSRKQIRRALDALSGRGDASRQPQRSEMSDEHVIAASGLFDAEFYLTTYPDVADARCDPARHFLDHGSHEGRSPGRLFDCRRYLELNRDVKDAGLNPLLHFILFGVVERRPGGVSLQQLPTALRLGMSQF